MKFNPLPCIFFYILFTVGGAFGQNVITTSGETKAIGIFYTIDDWDDLPLFYFRSEYVLMPNNKEQFNITIWRDGRIAWRDFSKLNATYYFKERIPPQQVSNMLEKLTNVIDHTTTPEKTREPSHVIPLINESLVRGAMFSNKHVKVNAWSPTLLSHYKNVQETFSNKEKMLMIEAINRFRYKSAVLFIYRETYNERISLRGSPYTTEEIYEYAERFVFDADYFLLFENLIKRLIPTNQGLSSSPVKQTRKTVLITKDQDGKIFYKIDPL